jgi:ribosomal-protein-alanine N-acetyltransferase
MCPVIPDEAPVVRVRHAGLHDLPSVVRIERTSFSDPWPSWSLKDEMMRNDSVFLVAELAGEVVSYAGMRFALDEGHVGTVAVTEEHRGEGLGEALMLCILDEARKRKLNTVFLEYRVGNKPAANLYAKLGYRPNRLRRGYYEDNGEDAVEAILQGLCSPERQRHLKDLRKSWESRHERHLIWDR